MLTLYSVISFGKLRDLGISVILTGDDAFNRLGISNSVRNQRNNHHHRRLLSLQTMTDMP